VSSADNPDLYLASQSPRRSQLLAQIGVLHAIVVPNVEEIPADGESPGAYVQRLAVSKARAGLQMVRQAGGVIKPVLGADTIVVSGQSILEKPRDAEHAAVMLRQLSGQTHQVFTAVAICNPERVDVTLVSTDVCFRELTDAEISLYWQTGEPCDKAGGYAIQGLGAVFIDEIRGSFSNVVGLPLEATRHLLESFGVPWWQAAK